MASRNDQLWIERIKKASSAIQGGFFAHLALRVTVNGRSHYEELLFLAKDLVESYLNESDKFFKLHGTVLNLPDVYIWEHEREYNAPEICIPDKFFAEGDWIIVGEEYQPLHPDRYEQVRVPNEAILADKRREAYLANLKNMVGKCDENGCGQQSTYLHEFATCVGFGDQSSSEILPISACNNDFNGYGVAMYYLAAGRSIDFENATTAALSLWLVSIINHQRNNIREQKERIEAENRLVVENMKEISTLVFEQSRQIGAIDEALKGDFGLWYSRHIDDSLEAGDCSDAFWKPPQTIKDRYPSIAQCWNDHPGSSLPEQLQHFRDGLQKSVLHLLFVLYANDTENGKAYLDNLTKLIDGAHQLPVFDLDDDRFIAVSTGLYKVVRTAVFKEEANSVDFAITWISCSPNVGYLDLNIDLGTEDNLNELCTGVNVCIENGGLSNPNVADVGGSTRALCNLLGHDDFCCGAAATGLVEVGPEPQILRVRIPIKVSS